MIKSQLAISIRGHKEKMFVPAFHDGEAGIAFHHPFNEKRSWQFSHIKSGLGLGIFAKNIKQAEEIFERLTKHDWSFNTLSDVAKEKTKALRDEVRAIKDEFGLHRNH